MRWVVGRGRFGARSAHLGRRQAKRSARLSAAPSNNNCKGKIQSSGWLRVSRGRRMAWQCRPQGRQGRHKWGGDRPSQDMRRHKRCVQEPSSSRRASSTARTKRREGNLRLKDSRRRCRFISLDQASAVSSSCLTQRICTPPSYALSSFACFALLVFGFWRPWCAWYARHLDLEVHGFVIQERSACWGVRRAACCALRPSQDKRPRRGQPSEKGRAPHPGAAT